MMIPKKIYLPALAVVIVSLLLVAYSMYSQSHSPSHMVRPPEGMKTGDFRPEGSGDTFQTLGTVAVICGAVSFAWLLFRKKLASPSRLVRKFGKLLYKIHTYTGWAALALIAVHGTYFLLNKPQDDKIYTGLAGFIILLALAGYGLAINRVKNKYLRLVHRMLSFVWIPILLLHAGGSFIAAALTTLALWGAVWIVERSAARKPAESGT